MDTYSELVSTGYGRKFAKALGLPTPVELRRYSPGQPLLDAPVLLIGSGSLTDTLTGPLSDWGLGVQTPVASDAARATEHSKWGAILLDLTELSQPSELAEPALALAAALKRLDYCGRVITISRAEEPANAPAVRAARTAVTGMMRSLGKELRAGATANGIVLAADTNSVDSLGALRFLLSGRSAYVDGQFITVTGTAGPDPSFERPLAGRVAVVTGAARGIGATIVQVLARDGAKVIGVDVPAAGESLAAGMNQAHGVALQLDVTAPDAGAQILAAAKAHFGAVDIVVHNAGILRDKLLANMTADRWNELMAVNLGAPLAMNKQFLAAAGDGLGPDPRFISISSTSGIAGNRGQTNYAAAKAGLIGMTESLAVPLAEIGGTANAVAPGFIETEMTARIPVLTRQIARRLNSLQQGGLPVDVAEAVSFLASPSAGGINGSTLRVCGQHMVGR